MGADVVVGAEPGEFEDACMEASNGIGADFVVESVGGYRLEGPGAQLFSRIDGDFFTILGLPLLPLLAFLRGHGIGVE